MKKLYLVTRTDEIDYDQFSALVVCARDEYYAREIDPCNYVIGDYAVGPNSWTTMLSSLDVTYLGVAEESLEYGIVLGSFNAG